MTPAPRQPAISGDAGLVRMRDAAANPPTADDLHDLLIANTIEAIYVQGVCTPSEGRSLADVVSARRRRHDRIGGLAIVGSTHYQSDETADPEISGPQFDRWLRSVTADPSPLDKCQSVFAGLSRDGEVGKLRGSDQAPRAILRHYCGSEASEILPHQDVIQWDIDFGPDAAPIGQAGWNLYCDVCSAGGDLCLFGARFDQEEYLATARGNYGFPWEAAGEPAVRLKPCVGDMVLINTGHLHAIHRVEGRRVTLSGFLGCYSDGRLECWA